MTASVHPDMSPNPASVASPAALPAVASPIRSWLFTRYDALLVGVVAVTLLSGGIFEVFSHYREHRAALVRIQHEQAKAAAAKISQFIEEIESQLGWTTQLPWAGTAPENRRFDALRLLRQVPAITELMMVDSTGRERLRVSRFSMDVVDSGNDFSQDPKFTEAVAHKVYFGPVYFRRESEPYMTVALSGGRKDAGVSIAEVNLKVIWDVVSQVKVGEHGHAYVVSARGRLIAHPDMGLVLRNTDMSKLAQVQAAAQAGTEVTSDALEDGRDIQGQEVLTASAPILPLRWTMFVDRPVEEAHASLYAALQRLAIVLAAALIFTTTVGMLLTRRIVGPFEALRAGAAQFGAGDFGLGAAPGFRPYPRSESERSNERLRQMAALEMAEIISSSESGLRTSLDTLVQSVVRLCSAECALLDEKHGEELQTLASVGFSEDFAVWRKSRPVTLDPGSTIGRALIEKRPVQTLDVLAEPESQVLLSRARAGFRTMLAVPLMHGGEPAGVLILTRMHPQLFDETQIEIVAAFADLAPGLIANAALLGDLRTQADVLSQPCDPSLPAS